MVYVASDELYSGMILFLDNDYVLKTRKGSTMLWGLVNSVQKRVGYGRVLSVVLYVGVKVVELVRCVVVVYNRRKQCTSITKDLLLCVC